MNKKHIVSLITLIIISLIGYSFLFMIKPTFNSEKVSTAIIVTYPSPPRFKEIKEILNY